MILEKLVLHDFGIYAGRHEVDLRPPSPSQPVVLFGALNGRGKTTLFDAINLALYGQRARLSNRKNLAWEEYLKRAVNQQSSGGASVSLQLSVHDLLESHTYEIRRHWQETGKGVREHLSVLVDGEVDQVITDEWSTHVESILPVDVASLNFFDGEKIDELADPARSREVIRAAIRGLLGINLLERLEADLKVLLRRQQLEVIGDEVPPELVDAESELERLSVERERLVLATGALRVDHERQTQLHAAALKKAHDLGADRWQQREDLATRLRETTVRRAETQEAMVGAAAGSAPLKLLAPLLQRLEDQLRKDQETQQARTVLSVLETRDESTLSTITGDTSAIAEFLAQDRERWKATANRSIVHAESTSGPADLTLLLTSIDDSNDVAELLTTLRTLDDEIHEIERTMSTIPTDEQLLPLLGDVAESNVRLEQLFSDLEAASSELEQLQRDSERAEAKVERIRAHVAEQRQQSLDATRSRNYIEQSLDTVRATAKRTIDRNLERLETSIFERFSELIGKANLISAVTIDADTLELQIHTRDGEQLPVERLSAGERQLLATAVLWGLSSASGRAIPLVIDTPLARLDGEHRRNLVKNYFPHAAEQVIILSTDQEVDDDLLRDLTPALGRTFTIMFDGATGSSRFVDGYEPNGATQ